MSFTIDLVSVTSRVPRPAKHPRVRSRAKWPGHRIKLNVLSDERKKRKKSSAVGALRKC